MYACSVADETKAVRASDGEREQTVELLRAHAADGRRTVDEFSERVDEAYAARTRAELDALVDDLPRPRPACAVTASPWRSSVTATPKRFTGSGVRQRGAAGALAAAGDPPCSPPSSAMRTSICARPSSTSRPSTITALLLFGNADFYVQTGADIDLGGLTVFGHRREHGDDAAPAAGAPLVRIRVYSLFGTSDVWYVPRDATGSFRELIKSVRKRGRAAERRELRE